MLYPSAFCPQVIKHPQKIHTEFHKNKKEIVNFCFSVKWQNLFFRQISTERRAPTVHRTGGAFFRLSFVENVRRQNVKPVFSQDFNRATRNHRRADGAFFRLLSVGKLGRRKIKFWQFLQKRHGMSTKTKNVNS